MGEYTKLQNKNRGYMTPKSWNQAIGLKEAGSIKAEQLKQIDTLHYEVENRLLRQVESLEKKRKDGTWSDRISDEKAIYLADKTINPIIHYYPCSVRV